MKPTIGMQWIKPRSQLLKNISHGATIEGKSLLLINWNGKKANKIQLQYNRVRFQVAGSAIHTVILCECCLNPNLEATYSMNSFPFVVVNFVLSRIIKPKQLSKFYFPLETAPPHYIYMGIELQLNVLCVRVSVFPSCSPALPRMHKYLIFLSPYLFLTQYYATDKRWQNEK